MQRHITILDSTLRDGAQGEGISFSVEDKIGIVRALDELGIAYLEAGNPASNPKELEFFDRAAALPLKTQRWLPLGAPAARAAPQKRMQIAWRFFGQTRRWFQFSENAGSSMCGKS